METLAVHGHAVRVLPIRVTDDIEIELLQPLDREAWLEEAVRGARDPYAGMVWPASLAAARVLLSRLTPGEVVVDAGSGAGLVSLTAARAGARVTALDYDEVALCLVRAAAARQGLAVETQVFDFRSQEPLPLADIIVFADLLYEEELGAVVAGRALEAVRRGMRVIVADPGRIGRYAFTSTLMSHGHKPCFEPLEVEVPDEARRERIGVAWLGAG